MPRKAYEWTFSTFHSPEQMRAEAQKWEEIATEAELDGDLPDAERSRREAASLRQMAREKAVDARAAKEGNDVE